MGRWQRQDKAKAGDLTLWFLGTTDENGNIFMNVPGQRHQHGDYDDKKTPCTESGKQVIYFEKFQQK
jgi:hypothetical protein